MEKKINMGTCLFPFSHGTYMDIISLIADIPAWFVSLMILLDGLPQYDMLGEIKFGVILHVITMWYDQNLHAIQMIFMPLI